MGGEELGGKVFDGGAAVVFDTFVGEGAVADHEEMETWEGDEVDAEFAEIGVEHAWETEGTGYAGHDPGDKLVEIGGGGFFNLHGVGANREEGFVVNGENGIAVFNELME